MQQTNLRVLNFALIFFLALLTAYFTLENTASTNINIIPGVSTSIPIAALVIISAGIGSCGAWSFATWSDKIREDEIKELEYTKNRLKELELNLDKLKSKQDTISPSSLINSSALKESTDLEVLA